MSNKKGFTLVELLAVVAIMGLLMTIAIPSYLAVSKSIKKKMWDSKLKTIESAAQLWADDNKSTCLSKIDTLTVKDLINGGYLKADEKGGSYVDPSGTIEDVPTKTLKDLAIDQNICPVTVASQNEEIKNSYFSESDLYVINPISNTYEENALYLINDGTDNKDKEIILNDDVDEVSVEDSCNSFYIQNGKLYASGNDRGTCDISLTKNGTTKTITIYNLIPDVYAYNVTKSIACSTNDNYNYSFKLSYEDVNSESPYYKDDRTMIRAYDSDDNDITDYYSGLPTKLNAFGKKVDDILVVPTTCEEEIPQIKYISVSVNTDIFHDITFNVE